jgi:hypothetical protein
MEFDKKKHADTLIELELLVCHCMMLSEGLRPANNQMSDRQYCNTAAGAFGLMAFALNHAYDLISEQECVCRAASKREGILGGSISSEAAQIERSNA